MKVYDLVIFDRNEVSNLLSDAEPHDDWKKWVGIILAIENEDFCRVAWHDGCIRQEFIENLEVINEKR